MIEHLRFRNRLAKLQRSRAKTVRIYRTEAEAARRQLDWEQVQKSDQSEWFEVSWIDEEIDHLISRRLLDRAERLLVIVPPDDEVHWTRGSQTGQRFLTRQGMVHLRAVLRKEDAESSSLWLAWGGWATGLVGALTGLAAVLTKAG